MNYRKGDWIQTFTGVAFWPLDPHPSEIDIRDIAHSLAHQCRYGGHSKRFYSVAEHCVLLSRVAPAELALSALMHDAAEAYMVDVPRPIKGSLGGYRDIERGLEAVIMPRFGLPFPIPALVMELDHRILTDERQQLMSTPPMPWGDPGEALGVSCDGWEPIIAERAFLRRFGELSN